MPVEIEAKMKVASFEPVLAALREHHATSLGEHIETDAFFDTSDRKLLAADKGLRLAVDVASNKSEVMLTHKGPVGHGQLKKRQETQTVVGNPEAMAKILEQ